MFQNLGDGTLAHSGSLAIRACVAADVNITFKILFNSAVAMTGGQAAQGALTIPQLTKKLEAEGVRKIVVLAEDPDRWANIEFAANAQVRDRSELENTLAELEKQTPCAMVVDLMMPVMGGAELRRNVQQMPDMDGVPFILVSGEPDAVQIGHDLDATAVVPKPFS